MGARDLLLKSGQWRATLGDDVDDDGSQPAVDGAMWSSLNINPFSAEVLQEAKRVANETSSRRSHYAQVPPPPPVERRREQHRQAREQEQWTPFRLPELRPSPSGCEVTPVQKLASHVGYPRVSP